MVSIKGYIYIRCHSSYDSIGLCKIGKTGNIPERDVVYATGEPVRGVFEVVLEVKHEHMTLFENLLKQEFNEFNVVYDGGTEFFRKEVIDMVVPYFEKLCLPYRKLTMDEIRCLTREVRLKKIKEKIVKAVLRNHLNKNKLVPREDQKDTIEKTVSHLLTHNKCLLVLMCGVGKTLISLWIAQRMNVKTLVIGVPNILLVDQWFKNVCNIFPNHSKMLVKEQVKENAIEKFLYSNKKLVIITTYASSYKVNNASKSCDFVFDFKINDEAHHLTSIDDENDKKTNRRMLEIDSCKQISLTATLKVLEKSNYDTNGKVISNDNINYFGEVVERKSLLWSIHLGVVCDYEIQTIVTDDMFNGFTNYQFQDDNDKRMFMSAITSLKSIESGDTSHLLIYTNNMENINKINKYIELLLNDEFKYLHSSLCYSGYDSGMKKQEQSGCIERFKNARYGIITCVYCLGEGWDFPILDGVVFSENMTSNIRIVQSALRASRLNKNRPDKIAKIILPIIVNNDVEYVEHLVNNCGKNDDMKKVKDVIYHMGLEDETICQKLKVFKIDICKNKNPHIDKNTKKIGQYDKELTTHLLLNTVRRSGLGVGYDKAKRILKEKKLISKDAYYQLCDNDVRLPKEPEVIYKNQFTNWIDYLGIERVYYDKETCIKKVQDYLDSDIKSNLSMICKNACLNDDMFPPVGLWVDYYQVKTLEEIVVVKNMKKKKKINFVNV